MVTGIAEDGGDDDDDDDGQRYLRPPDVPVRSATVDGNLPPDALLAAALAAVQVPR